MKLSQQLEKQLSGLEGEHQSQDSPSQSGGAIVEGLWVRLAEQRHGFQLECRLQQVEQLASSLWELALTIGQPLTRGFCAQYAEILTKKMTYLPDQLTLIENSHEGTILRSETPHRSEGGFEYLELDLVPDGRISLRGYLGARGSVRQPRAFCLTRAVLSRVVDDLLAAVVATAAHEGG